LLSAVLTGIGAVGFVTFFGGAVIWTRADALGIPAFETVGLLPTSVLITTGAHFLVAAMLVAVLAVAVLYVYNVVEKLPIKQAMEQAQTERATSLEAARRALILAKEGVASASGALAAAQANKEAADRLSGREYDDVKQSTATAVDQAQTDSQTAKAAEVDAQEEVDKLNKPTRADAFVLRHRQAVTLITSGVLLLLVELVLMGFAGISVFAYLFLAALSLITTALSVAVYAETNRFSWFGVAAFISVSLFIGASTYFRTRAYPEAEPAAALVSSTKAVAGYFVAQTSDRIYLGEPAGSGLPSRLVALNRAQVTALTIAALTTIKRSHAIDAARRMAVALCRQVPPPSAQKALARRGVCPSLTGVAPLY
jgi:hypothetical protein